jgi:hypothetical protein
MWNDEQIYILSKTCTFMYVTAEPSAGTWDRFIRNRGKIYRNLFVEEVGSEEDEKEQRTLIPGIRRLPKRRNIKLADVIRSKLRSQNYRCAITGVPLSPETTAIDHILPIARGGRHTADNLQLVNRTANAIKSTLTMEELLGLALLLVRTVPCDPDEATKEMERKMIDPDFFRKKKHWKQP